MSASRFKRELTATLIVSALFWTAYSYSHAQQKSKQAEKHDRARVSLTMPLPRLDGDHLRATLVEVYYGPGEASPPHSHPCAVVGYVVEGAIRTQVQGEPLRVYRAGDSFFEGPNGVHAISANASATEPAKFVAYFVCDHEGPLSSDVPVAQHGARDPHNTSRTQ